MIFGFNTDVDTKDAVYHVQTEDRGSRNPIIDSIIYVGGKIVDRRRTSYVPSEVTQQEVEEMVRRQHRELVEAIRSGNFVPAGPVSASEGTSPAGYTIRLLNGKDLVAEHELRFELAVQEGGSGVPATDVSIELRWLLQQTVAQQWSLRTERAEKMAISVPVPADCTEGMLVVRVTGARGREFAKFHARAALP